MKQRYRLLTAALTIFLALSFLTGCGKKDELVLARVGGDEITARDMDEIYGQNRMNFASYEDEYESRRAVLDSLIMQRLLIKEAYKRNIDASEEVNRIVLASYDRFLLDILYQREINDKIKITDEDLKDFYNQLEYKIQASHILVTTEDSAKMLLDSIKNGASFEDLAVRYSKDQTARTNRGDLGYFSRGKLDHIFEENAFKLNPGEISSPFKTRFGWHIVKVVDRAINEERQSFDKMKDQIRATLDNLKRFEVLENYTNGIKAKYPVKVETSTCDYVLHRRSALYPPQLLEQIPKNDFDLAQLDRDEKELILATWEGGQISLGDYLTKVKKLRGAPKPDFDDTAAMAEFIFQMNLMEILGVEARKVGLENDPEFKRKITRFRELAMADIMENDSLIYPPPPDDGEVRQYYEDHIADYTVPPKAHLYEILVSSEELALKLKSQIRSLAQFKKLADEYTERPGKRGSGGDLGVTDHRYYPDLFKYVDQTPVGEIAGPIPTIQRYAVIYVADKQAEEIRDFNIVKQNIKDRLDRERRSKALAEWVEKQKENIDVKIYEENLRASINKAKYAAADSTLG